MDAFAHSVLIHIRRLAETAQVTLAAGTSPGLESLDLLFRQSQELVVEIERQLAERQREASGLRLLAEQARMVQIALRDFIRSLPPPTRPAA